MVINIDSPAVERFKLINQMFADRGKPYKAVAYKDFWNGGYTTIKCECKIHGEWITKVKIVEGGNGCPACTWPNQTKGYINAVIHEGEVIAFKFGIASDPDQRLREQNNKNKVKMQRIALFTFPSVHICREAEKEAKALVKRSVVPREIMKEGYTETTHNITDVLKIFSKYC